MSRVILLVTSDIYADQRVHRSASTLHEEGYKVLVLGRRLKTTPKKIERPYGVALLRLPFSKGVLFYASYNIWAFFYLLYNGFKLVHANDLDTLLAARLACLIKRKPIVFDSHELFTEVPELQKRPFVKKIWTRLEQMLVPGIKNCSTVSEGVANELKLRHGIEFVVIRNFPTSKKPIDSYNPEKKVVIYQGALNIGRGLERLIKAMQFVTDAYLYIAGAGDIMKELELLVEKYNLEEKVEFFGRLPLEELHEVTCKATIGVSLEEDMGLNYRYALPNKVFDYIQAGLPVVVSDLPEMKKMVESFNVGTTVSNSCNAYALAEKLSAVLNNTNQLTQWHENAVQKAKQLVWEQEKIKFLQLVKNALIKK